MKLLWKVLSSTCSHARSTSISTSGAPNIVTPVARLFCTKLATLCEVTWILSHTSDIELAALRTTNQHEQTPSLDLHTGVLKAARERPLMHSVHSTAPNPITARMANRHIIHSLSYQFGEQFDESEFMHATRLLHELE